MILHEGMEMTSPKQAMLGFKNFDPTLFAEGDFR